jgi:hypothetical protein
VLPSGIAVQNANCRIEPGYDYLHANLAFQDAVGVIEHGINWVGRITVRVRRAA